jgi:cell division protein FtsW
MRARSEKIVLLAVVILLCLLGLFFVFEASAVESYTMVEDTYFQFKKQLIGFGIGLVGLFIMSRVPTKWLLKAALPLYVLAIILTILCFVPAFSNVQFGAHRWLEIFGFSLQTVEVMKLCLIIFFAWLFSRKMYLPTFIGFFSVPVLLIILQSDLGSLLVVGACLVGMYFLAGAKPKDLGILAGGGLVLILIMMIAVPYRRVRLLTYFHLIKPSEETQVNTWHIEQAMLGLGRGGLFGQGIGNSRQKFSFVPEPSTDSIFAIVGEEVGFFGCALILLLYLLFVYLIYRVTRTSDLSLPESLIGYGVMILFAAQIFLNIAAISSLTPFTGITLPFFSYGSSSLVMSLALVGVVLGLGKEKR